MSAYGSFETRDKSKLYPSKVYESSNSVLSRWPSVELSAYILYTYMSAQRASTVIKFNL